MSTDIIFDSENVDIESIMSQIKERVKQRGYDEGELSSLSKPLEIKTAVPAFSGARDAAAQVKNVSTVQYWWVMPKGNPVKTFIKKVVRKLNYFYLKHTFDQQNIFNASTAAALEKLAAETEALKVENAQLKRRLDALDGSAYDSFDYEAFEDKFRGSSDDIKSRQKKYLPYFSGRSNVLDIGCGRGEFLDLLFENGISAKGVDLSAENIKYCVGKDVVLADGIRYLETVPDNSLGGIFCAQVIEHISTNELIKLMSLANRKLQQGASAIFETLNPKCLMIYAESMYLDPSHTKPVHPLTVQFIAEQAGFESTELLYSTPTDEKYRMPEIKDNDDFNRSAGIINDLIFGNREYALVCTKQVKR